MHAAFPSVDAKSLTHLGSGWEFDAFATADGWVFRFPRRAEAAGLFDVERPVHALAVGVLPPNVAIPRVELRAAPTLDFPYPFAGHRYVGGVPCDEIAESLRSTLARSIAAALGAIHSIPIDDARAAGVAEMQTDDIGRQEWFNRGRATAASLRGIDPAMDEATRWMETLPSSIDAFTGSLRFIHHDLGAEHVLADPATGQLTGIIDWTDAILGDPARDFVFLVTSFGWEVANRVIAEYPHAVDDGFRERLRFMSRLLSTIWIAHAMERGEDPSKHIRWLRNAWGWSQSQVF